MNPHTLIATGHDTKAYGFRPMPAVSRRDQLRSARAV